MAVFARFLDNTDVRPLIVKQDTLSFEERKDLIMYNAFEDVEQSKTLSVLFTQDELNLCANAYIKEKIPQSRGACFTFKDENIIYMEFSVKIGGIKTVVRANLMGTFIGEDFHIALSDVKIGKAGDKLTKLLFTAKNVTKILQENNIFASYNGKTSVISITRQQMKTTFAGFYQKSENAELYTVLMNRAFSEDDMIDILWCKNGKFGATARLSSLEYSEDSHGSIPYTISFDEVKDKVCSLLDSAVITPKHSNIVFKYLIQGYSLLNDQEKQVIVDLDLSAIDIAHNTVYKGVFAQYQQSITDIIATQLKNISIGSGSVRLQVDEDALNNIFIMVPVIGQGGVYSVKNKAKHALSFVAVESMYFNIVKDNINITLIVNINGFKVAVSSDFYGYSSSDFAFTVELKCSTIGSLSATNDENASMMNYLKTAFVDENWIICDTDNQSITFDFEKVIDNNILSLFLLGIKVKVSAQNGAKDIGYLAVDISPSFFN